MFSSHSSAVPHPSPRQAAPSRYDWELAAIRRAALATLLLMGLPLWASADNLTVTINNIEKAGEINVAVYDNAGRLTPIGARVVAPGPASQKVPGRW